MDIIKSILATIIVIVVIMFMIQVFKTSTNTDDADIMQIDMENRQYIPQAVRYIYPIIQYLELYIDCDIMDMNTLNVTFDGLEFYDYIRQNTGFIQYTWLYDCSINKFNMTVTSLNNVTIDISIKDYGIE